MGAVKDFLIPHLAPLATPYLFVGAGLSRRYASLPSWSELLRLFADKTGQPYEFYLSAADGDLPLAATKIAEAFHGVWFSAPEYEDSRGKWQSKVVDQAGPLKIEIAKLLDEQVAAMTIPQTLEAEWTLLKASTVDGIVTTNYDRVLAEAFPSYLEYVGQEGMLFSDTQGIAETYAIHGSTRDPMSLVLTQSDYERFDARNAYLAAKLITIFVEHPVVFLGYSFNDGNVQRMLTAIVQGLQNHSIDKLRDRLIFVEWRAEGDASVEVTDVNISGHLLPITRIRTPGWTEVFEALGSRKHALPARTLRILKEQVYEIVRSNDPKDRLFAYADIDSAKAEDISIVFGVGAKIAATGIVGMNRSDIIADVLENPPGGLPADDILQLHISKIPSNWWYPVFKYLREAGHLDSGGKILDETALPAQVVKLAQRNRTEVVTKFRYRRRATMAALEAKHDWRWVFSNFLEVPSYIEFASDLRDYLIVNAGKLETEPQYWHTNYSKGVVAYDYVRYGLGWK